MDDKNIIKKVIDTNKSNLHTFTQILYNTDIYII